MLTIYHKNTVMHGCLDYFCLACEEHLKTDDDVNLHIDKPEHEKNLVLALYVDSCREDRIRKVNKRYYCECCNILLPTMTKVNLHIKEDKHEFNKTDETDGEMKKSVFLRWIKNSVVAFDDLLINEQAWHGFVDDTCVICDSEFDDAAMHRSEVGHLLKMIQAKVQVGSDNFISRKIDDSSFQCLTCNIVISHGDMITHSDKTEHSKRYLECRKAKRALGKTESKKATDKAEPKEESKKVQPEEEEDEKEEPIKEEAKNEEEKTEEANKEVPKKKAKKEKAKKEELNKEAKKEELRKEEAKKEALRKEEARKEEAKKEELLKEEAKNEELRKEEARKEELSEEEAKKEELRKEEAKKEALRKEEKAEKEALRKEEAKKEELKKAEAKQDELRKEEAKKEELKKEEAKKEVPKKESKKTAKKDTDKKPAKTEVMPVPNKDETKGQYEKDINEVLGTHQYLKFLPGNMSALCIICDWSINVFSISQHVNSQHHLTLLRMHEDKAIEMRKAKAATKAEVAKVEAEKNVSPDKENDSKIANAEAKAKRVADEENKSKIIDSIQTLQKKDILIDLISEKAFCKKCSANVKYEFEDIEKHIEDHKNEQIQTQVEKYPSLDKSLNKTEVKRPEPETSKTANKPATNAIIVPNDAKPIAEHTKPDANVDSLLIHLPTESKAIPNGANALKAAEKDTKPETKDAKPAVTETKTKPFEDIETYTKNNEITYNKTHSKAYCRLCETKVPSTLKCLQEHVQGNNHQMKKNKEAEVTEDDEENLYETKTMDDYIQIMTVVENMFRHDCVINDDICLNVASFLMLTKIDRDRVRCQVCEKTMPVSEINDHKDTKQHQKFMKTTKVLYTIDDEFVREVRPGIFHCGFCNMVEAGWTSLQMHFRSFSHKQMKQGCEWMLQEHMPLVREHRVRKQHAEFMFIVRMLMGRPLW